MAQAYLGAIGRTRTATVRVSDARGALVGVQIYTSIDAAADPALAGRLRGDALNVAWLDGRELRVAVPVVYHDPAARLLVLVLGDAHRHREIEERIRVLQQLRDDSADVPAYAKDFAVVFGAAGLRALLEQRAWPRDRSAIGRGEARSDDLGRLAAGPDDAPDLEPRIDARPSHDLDPEADAGLDAEPVIDDDAAIDPDAEPVIEDQAVLEAEPGFDSEVALGGDGELDADAAFDGEAELDADAPLDMDVAAAGEPGLDGEPALDADAVNELAAALDAEAIAGDGFGDAPQRADAQQLADAEAIADAEALAADAALVDAEVLAAGFDDADVIRPPDTLPEAAAIAIELARPRAATVEPDDAAPGADPLTTEVSELPLDAGDRSELAAGADGTVLREPGWQLDAGAAHLVLEVDAALADALGGPLDLRLVLHRAPSAPVIAVVLASPTALRAATPGRFAAAALDVAAERDRAVLKALGRSFELSLALVRDGQLIRRCRLTAPLADNVGYLVQAADEHLHGVAERETPDWAAARDLVLGAGFDLLGIGHAERGELRADKLAQIATARQLRRALAIARHFTWPASEDYLVCIRGFPLSRWHQLRRTAVARAVAWGLWMGPELAQIAVSEGFARSRRDLIARLDRGFEQLRHDPRAFDIDAETAADNASAIAEQARALGVQVRAGASNAAGAIASDATAVASGSIDLTPLPEAAPRTIDELLALLDDTTAGRGGRTRRLAAALALCDLADPRAAGPVVGAALKMSRGEAVRVLAGAVKFGPAAQPALIAGLASSKAYARHGCALALALARSDDATQAVIALLRSEPTELWHEIARAIGQIGTPALVWLVRDAAEPRPGFEERGEERVAERVVERVARAMAHVGANGGQPALTAIAAADSIVAPIAARALELLAAAAGDRSCVDPDAAGSPEERDLSVNHAFSRQFFAALDRGVPADADAAITTRDATAAES